MKKTLLILCALLLTSIGASAQTPYEFHAEDWVSLDLTRVTADGITYNDDNTITVAPINGASGTNNVALGNSLTYSAETVGITTNGYYITSDQTCFVIVGKDLSTSGISDLWWLNGVNANVTASTAITLDDGQVMAYWDFSNNTTVMAKFVNGQMAIDGWTGGGLTSTGTTATISYIGFCKPSEATSSFTIPENTYVHACTANESVWSTTATLADSYHLRIDTWATQSDEKMSVPFMEYYADGDAYLPDATINHHQLTGLTAGVYEVSMDIRIIDFAKDGDSNAKIGAGTRFIANGVSEDILTGSDGTEDEYGEGGQDEVYGTYTLTCVVGEEGTLDISLDVKDATYSWIMFKNLKVKLLETATITWEMTSAGWGTLILPFDADVPSGLTLYAGSALTIDDSTITVGNASETIAANTPYLVSGTEGTYTFSGTYEEATGALTSGMLTGTLVDMTYSDFTANSGQYVLQNHTGEGEDGLAFYPITEASTGVTLDAYHCYLSTSSNFLALHLPGVATAIEAVESETLANDAIYDLSGRRVAKAVKGVYIQNGKKVLVK